MRDCGARGHVDFPEAYADPPIKEIQALLRFLVQEHVRYGPPHGLPCSVQHLRGELRIAPKVGVPSLNARLRFIFRRSPNIGLQRSLCPRSCGSELDY